MIAEKIVLDGVIDTLCDETVRLALKNELRPHLKAEGCIPKGEDAAFVANMQDVLDLYCQPYGAEIPIVCIDEEPYQRFEPHPVK